MQRFYTFCKNERGVIYHRYIEDGKSHSERRTNFDYELFIRSNRDVDSQSLYGDPLLRREFSSIYDMQSFNKEMTASNIPVFGMTKPEPQFLFKEYNDEIQFVFNQIKIVTIDIETLIPDDGTFCSPLVANQPVTAITMKLFGQPSLIFGYKEDYTPKNNGKYFYCADEESMLESFIDEFKRISPDVITGWNCKQYDIPFLINRINRIIASNYANILSPFNSFLSDPIKMHQFKDEVSYEIFGIITLDYLEVYKEFSLGKQDSYKLDNIAEFELGENKLDYSEYKNLNDLYYRNFSLYLDYNDVDVQLVERLDNKLNFLNTIFSVAYDGRINYDDCFSQTKFWDSKIYFELRNENLQIPPKSSFQRTDIPGGHVKDVHIGLHDWVCSFDLNSLYPNIMMMLNISPETIVNEMDYSRVDEFKFLNIDTIELKDLNLCMAANGARFKVDNIGIIPRLLKTASEKRVFLKNKMLSVRKKLEAVKTSGTNDEIQSLEFEYKMLDSAQNTMKIQLNSIYGALACPHFRYFNPSIASAITLTGQSIIQFIENRVNIFMNLKLKTEDVDYVILSDTDSIAIKLDKIIDLVLKKEEQDIDKVVNFIINFGQKILNPLLSSSYLEFEKSVNAFESRLVMKMENVCDKTLCVAKKNYIMSVRWSEGTLYKKSKLKIMGISVARSTVAKFIKKAITECINIILFEDEEKFQTFVKDFKQVYLNTNIELIANTSSVTDIKKYDLGDCKWATCAPVAVKAAIVYNHLIKKHKLAGEHPEIINGNKCKFVYLKQPNIVMNNAIAFIDKIPPEFGINDYIDWDVMFEKTFLKPVEILSSKLNWKLEKINTLDDFF